MGSTYVSDPRVWKTFYQNMFEGGFKPSKYRGRQTVGRIGGMFSKKPYMIPVNPHLSRKESIDQVVGKHVTPMAAVEERAKEEMKEAIKEKIPHVSEKTIKAQKRQPVIKPKPTLKKKTPQKGLKRKRDTERLLQHLTDQSCILFHFSESRQWELREEPIQLSELGRRNCTLIVNGESMPARPMKIDVGANQNYVTLFVNLFEAAEKWNKDAGLEVTRSQFGKGYAIYAFNLAPSDLGEEYLNLVRQGNVRLEVKFAANTTETLNCLAYAEFPALLEVDQSRDIKYTKV